jgi:hypothetical protein
MAKFVEISGCVLDGVTGGRKGGFQPPVVPGEGPFDPFPAPDFPLTVDRPKVQGKFPKFPPGRPGHWARTR